MVNLAAKALSLDRTYHYDGITFGVIRNKRQVHPAFLENIDAVILQSESVQEANEILREVRHMPKAEDYLKPIFLHPHLAKDKLLSAEIDGVADPNQLQEAAEKSKAIYTQIGKVKVDGNKSQHPDGDMLLKASQFIFSRKKPLTPLRDRNAKLHYRFPFLTSFFEENGEEKALGVLRLGEKQGWFNTKMIDKLHLCPTCESAHSNLRATCTKCRSVNIQEEDLVHHFPCAHIAPISDFEKEGGHGLHCPKCDKALRHIGNDYDKPSAIYNCNDCHHTFQQPEYRSLCIDCGEDVPIEKMEETSIYSYELTAKGHSAIQNGTQVNGNLSVQKQPGLDEPGVFEFDVFKLLVRQEVAKQRTSAQPKAMVGQVKIDGLPLQNYSEDMQTRLSEEVCSIIKSYLKPADAVSSNGARTYYFMLSDAEKNSALQIKDVLTFNLNKLISSNLRTKGTNVQVELEPLIK